jgi:branched-chain amino acid transport system substrate-binding protein
MMRFRSAVAAGWQGLWVSIIAMSLMAAQITPSLAANQLNAKRTIAAVPDEKSAIRIGFLTPLSGVAGETGKDLLDGFRLYLDLNGGKMANKKVDLIVENDEANMATARAKVKVLVEEKKVDLIAGLLLAHIALAVAPLADKYGVPMVDAVAAPDELTQRKHPEWLIRTSYTASQPAHPFGDYAFKKLHYKRVVTLGLDFPYAWEQIAGFQRSFEEAGGLVVQKIWAPLGYTDFREYINSIRRDADAVFIVTTSDAAVALAKQYVELAAKLPIIGGGTTTDEVILRHLGKESVGAITAQPYSAALSEPACKRFVAAYRERHGNSDPGLYAEGGYTAAMWIDKAISHLHGNVSNKKKLLEALKTVELKDSPRGFLKLDSRSNPIETIYVRRVEMVNGKLVNKVIDKFPNVSQFWRWNPEEYLRETPYSKECPPCTHCN